MISAEPIDELKRSRFPFSPLVAVEVPHRLREAATDRGIAAMRPGPPDADEKKLIRHTFDLEHRAELDARDFEHLEAKAMTYAGALGEIDALHIEWGQTPMTEANAVALHERLGRILRMAGI